MARHYGLKVSEIKSRNNAKQIVFPRQVAMYLCKQLTDLSYPEIGKQFNDKHHSTVMHSVEKIDKLQREDRRPRPHPQGNGRATSPEPVRRSLWIAGVNSGGRSCGKPPQRPQRLSAAVRSFSAGGPQIAGQGCQSGQAQQTGVGGGFSAFPQAPTTTTPMLY